MEGMVRGSWGQVGLSGGSAGATLGTLLIEQKRPKPINTEGKGSVELCVRFQQKIIRIKLLQCYAGNLM